MGVSWYHTWTAVAMVTIFQGRISYFACVLGFSLCIMTVADYSCIKTECYFFFLEWNEKVRFWRASGCQKVFCKHAWGVNYRIIPISRCVHVLRTPLHIYVQKTHSKNIHTCVCLCVVIKIMFLKQERKIQSVHK